MALKYREIVGVSLPTDMMSRLKERKKRLGVPISRQLEFAVKEWLEKHE